MLQGTIFHITVQHASLFSNIIQNNLERDERTQGIATSHASIHPPFRHGIRLKQYTYS